MTSLSNTWGPELMEVDYVAYMSSIEHLQKTFTRSTSWPHEGLDMEDALLDMQTRGTPLSNSANPSPMQC